METPERSPSPRNRWFSDLPLRWKLIAGFGSLLLVGSIALAVISVVFINFRLANELMHHSLTTVAMADEWNANLVRAQSGYQSFLLTGDPAYLEAYETYRHARATPWI